MQLKKKKRNFRATKRNWLHFIQRCNGTLNIECLEFIIQTQKPINLQIDDDVDDYDENKKITKNRCVFSFSIRCLPCVLLNTVLQPPV